MTDKDRSMTKSTLSLSLVSALVIVVALQAWYMADMKQQLDDLRNQVPEQAANVQPPEREIKTYGSAIQPPQQSERPPQARPPGWQQHSPLDDDWFNQPFDAQNWDPYQEIQRMQHEMDQMFNEAFGRFNHSPGFKHLYRDRTVTPDIDLKDEGGNYIVIVDLPGAAKSDISVTLENQVLTISGKQNYAEQDTDSYGNIVFRERSSGTFMRSVTLPEPVKQSGMQTELDSGVLKITIPKAG